MCGQWRFGDGGIEGHTSVPGCVVSGGSGTGIEEDTTALGGGHTCLPENSQSPYKVLVFKEAKISKEHRILHARVSAPQPKVWRCCSSLSWVGESTIVQCSASSKETALPLLEMDEPRGGTVPRGGCGGQGETWEVSCLGTV